MLTASTTGSSACDDFTVGTLLGWTARQKLNRGSLLSGEELLVAVRAGIELWPGCCAGLDIGYGRSLGPRMRVRGQIGSRLGEESTSNKDGGNSRFSWPVPIWLTHACGKCTVFCSGGDMISLYWPEFCRVEWRALQYFFDILRYEDFSRPWLFVMG